MLAMEDGGLLRDAALRAAPVAPAGERLLAVAEELAPVVPALRRGWVVSVTGSTWLALRIAAGAAGDGAWVAAVGLPSLGVVAASEAGIDLDRFAVVAVPSPADWAVAVAAALDGVDVVLAGCGDLRVRATDARRLAARVRERGALLVAVGAGWPERADLRLTCASVEWSGLGAGHGHLAARRMQVVTSGRGAAARDRRAWVDAS